MRHYWVIAFALLTGSADAADIDQPCAKGPIILDDWDVRRVDADFREIWVTIRSTTERNIVGGGVYVEFFDPAGNELQSMILQSTLNLPAKLTYTEEDRVYRRSGTLLTVPREKIAARVCTDSLKFDDGSSEIYSEELRQELSRPKLQ